MYVLMSLHYVNLSLSCRWGHHGSGKHVSFHWMSLVPLDSGYSSRLLSPTTHT